MHSQETSWSREVFEAVEVLKDSEDEVLKNTDVEQANESAALEDASEKNNAKDDRTDQLRDPLQHEIPDVLMDLETQDANE
ncbi:hypothetical protein Taro_053306 [Colocasia esculenta]|uniref:Uncharacterized protein n=1 Tax=Colocasia esculenta TaxID=4460 RepID=A0A843XKK7_COLES|nr:hypothetical protein [Colocasia esculenta]